MKVILTPKRRGQHKLSVKVNGGHIMNSPFTVIINMPPKLLSQPVDTVSGLEGPTSLLHSEGKLLVTEKGRNRIIEIDSQLCVQEFKQLIGATELTQDTDHNLYVCQNVDSSNHSHNIQLQY